MARRMGKVSKVKNPNVSSIDKSMAKYLAKQANIKQPTIMKYASALPHDGGKSRKTTKVY
jgi:DNA-binding MurR/RpiR family transcriptional regulator